MAKSQANVSIVELSDGRTVCLSYGVIVAAFIPRSLVGFAVPSGAYSGPFGYVRTDARYSVTTSRHANQFAGRDSATIPDADLKALCVPLVSK